VSENSIFIPRCSIAAFAQSDDVAAALSDLATHPLLSRAQYDYSRGGLDAVINRYPAGGTPELIILEHDGPIDDLDRLAEVSAPSTQLIVISRDNDIGRYRRLLDRGGADYLYSPVDPDLLLATISRVFARAEHRTVASLITFMGCGGGSGASTMAQSAAVLLAGVPGKRVMLLDFDLFTGTVTLTFDLHPVRGLRDLLRDPKSINAQEIARLAQDRSASLQILCSAPTLDIGFALRADHFIDVLDQARTLVDYIVIDMPGGWSALHSKLLTMSELVQLVAVPTLGSFQALHNIEEMCAKLRANLPPADIVLNRWTPASEKLISAKLFTDAAKGGRLIRVGEDAEGIVAASAAAKCLAEVSPRPAILNDFNDHIGKIAGKREKKAAPQNSSLFRRLLGRKSG